MASMADCDRREKGNQNEETAEIEDRLEEDVYCFCQQPEFGDMIACDNKQCPIEWFHYPCVGIMREPPGHWYCDNCQDPGAEIICICKQVECGLVLQCSNRDCLIGQYHAQCVGVQAPRCSTSLLCDGCGK
ncbi:hypothetical protein ACROYT_G029808 [Oculina patagonica]